MGSALQITDKIQKKFRMRTAAVLTVLVAGAFAAPQPQFGGLKKLLNSFSGDEKPGSGDDGDYESVPYETIQEYEGYEERRYPSGNFACTELTYEMPEDKDDGEWTLEKVMEWMSTSKSRKGKPENKMFLKLFRYIAGVNSEAQEIEMTVPVISKLAPSEDNKITKEFQENPPQPIDKDVVIKKSSERVVFVKNFGGYAMRDSVWMDNAAAFREEISDRAEEIIDGYFYTAGYGSH